MVALAGWAGVLVPEGGWCAAADRPGMRAPPRGGTAGQSRRRF